MGLTRDAYYKHHKREERYQDREDTVIKLVQEIRKEQPRMGSKKLYNEIKPKLRNSEQDIGRDKFIKLLGERKMHVKRRKKSTKTTYSQHQYAVAPNRIKGIQVEHPNQVFVADITYIRLISGFAYLFLVTDLFSRKIVGYALSSSLAHGAAITALEMSLQGVLDPTGIIHHSDRGCQYCCHDFLKVLGKHNMVPSMTDESHCYQNAVAERVNGILKDEFYIDLTFKNMHQAQLAICDAIRIYNNKRPHWSLKLQTPSVVYAEAA